MKLKPGQLVVFYKMKYGLTTLEKIKAEFIREGQVRVTLRLPDGSVIRCNRDHIEPVRPIEFAKAPEGGAHASA